MPFSRPETSSWMKLVMSVSAVWHRKARSPGGRWERAFREVLRGGADEAGHGHPLTALALDEHHLVDALVVVLAERHGGGDALRVEVLELLERGHRPSRVIVSPSMPFMPAARIRPLDQLCRANTPGL